MSSGGPPKAASADERDACIPDTVKNFVFDLHDACRRSQSAVEARNLYVVEYRSLCEKYFSNCAWPSSSGISSECNADPIFLALYGELTTRHYHGTCRTTVADRIDSWSTYRHLFDTLLNLANDPGADTMGGLYVPAEWAFAAVNEFVYQFQAFCQFRTNVVGRKEHEMKVLRENRDAWAVETVMFYLHGLVRIAGLDGEEDAPAATQGHRVFGTYAAVGLSRLECLLGDYTSCLAALKPLRHVMHSIIHPPPLPLENSTGGPPVTPKTAFADPLHGIVPARATVAYHAGVSYLLLRRYRDAARIMSPMAAFLLRGLKNGTLRRLVGSEQLPKLNERMVTLLAILTHICPGCTPCVAEEVRTQIRDRHGETLAKIDAGDEGYEDLFAHACPKFVCPAVPNYDRAPGGAAGASQDASKSAYNLQVRQFISEVTNHGPLRKLRSYLRLYTSIRADKMAAFNDLSVSNLAELLCGYKLKMFQLERKDDADTISPPTLDVVSALEGSVRSALDVTYFVDKDMIHVEEDSKKMRFDEYFLKQIGACNEVLEDIQTIPITI
uniref:Eukaryotic translation initiation factor 3 subunit L n=1 Tax=Corethron hystrix TaxID=216773 RepID=A0A7S1FPR6_9STRA|eukprot:CAMPEP_0113309274 /NCGR_PEP_ID=MMETSP0010_2-20120614/7390_1 /TAXON_ID=216773 ORGANISM="Corethron hystrix, Strain 308" /NCGR_SAMPLE_ID=MMETSP0010_2 /ASSEMBLY_ACC=CAM_ASM_000155 /LENGTH=554 /DNA_ID=CAMNT_0000164507 /DNA_START=133 /DNA_END=1797 /DNA_ORIENTATION=- /assembly_acc=CAM_ASM_000155